MTNRKKLDRHALLSSSILPTSRFSAICRAKQWRGQWAGAAFESFFDGKRVLGYYILAMLPLASNASSAVSARLCRQLWQGLQPNIFASLCERGVEVHGFGERAFRAFKGSLILPVLI